MVREALEDLSTALRSEHVGHVAQEVLQAEGRVLRDDGQLQHLLLAAQRTGNVEGILRSGELAPNELGRLAKLDPQIFDGKVSFQQAVSYSVQGVPLTQLSRRQLGDIGEALHTFDLLKQGHTDIVSIKNASGHGNNIVSRNPQGELVFAEIKTSAQGKIIAPNTDAAEFVGRRLERAISELGHWATHNTQEGLQNLARTIRDEITNPDTGELKELDAKWINFTLEADPNSPQLRIGKTEQDWAKPAPKITLQPNQPDHPLYGEFSMILQHVPATWRGEQKENIAAGLLYEVKRDGLIDRLTRMVEAPLQADGTSKLFASGIRTANGMVFNVSVNMQEAAQQPLETTFAQLETLTQERALAAQKANELGPDDPGRGGPQMV